MADEKKEKGLGLLIGLGPTKPKSDGDSPASLAVSGLLSAIKDDDAGAVEEALRTVFDAFRSESSSDDMEE